MRHPAALACLVLAASPAAASPPCECEVAWSYPANAAVGVPTNAQILVWAPRLDGDSLAMAGAGDPPIPVTASATPTGLRPGQFLIVPAEPLAAQTAYTLKADLDGGGSFGISFTTGDGPDEAPPSLAGATVTGGALSGACRPHLAAVVSTTGQADDQTPASGLLVEVELTDPQAEPGRFTIYLPAGQRVIGDSGQDACLANAPGVQAEKQYQARVRLVDWAGNTSGYSDQLAFAFRKNGGLTGCGCGSDAPSTPAAWAAAALMLLALARSRAD